MTFHFWTPPPPTPQASLAARPGIPHLREGHRKQPVPGFCQKVAEGTVTKKIHNLIFPVVWNRQRCVTGCGTASPWPPNSAWTSAVRSSSLWSPVPVIPEATAHQNSKCRKTKSKQSFYLILAANIRDLPKKSMAAVTGPQTDLPGREISLIDHFCITGTKGGFYHQAKYILPWKKY